ncbi:MAG: type II secretion system protein GspC [Pseudomonadota bacterium]|nr:type II secretion system protein GspC [Pseudomonadota bacterium]
MRLTVPVNVVLIILLAHVLARLTWNLLPQPPGPPATPQESRAAAAPAASGTDYGAIADWHLFGKVDVARPAPPPPVAAAPETPLNLTLAGIFFAGEGGKGLALIEGAGDQLSYAVGEELGNTGARLEQILLDRVVLSRNGRMENLSLPKDAEGLETRPLARPTAEYAPPPPAAGEVIDASEIAEHFRQAAAVQPETLQDLAILDPYIQNGQFQGFRLRPGRNRRLLRQLGLRPGDVLTEVNGVPLNEPTRGLNLLQELLNADQVSVRVLRNGIELPLTFRMGGS